MNYHENQNLKKHIFLQRIELTHSNVYFRLSKTIKNPQNKATLMLLSEQEKADYNIWKNYTNIDVKPFKLYELFYYLCSLILGITFGVKLMEKGEDNLETELIKSIVTETDLGIILEHEQQQEKELVGIINEEKLNYVGSIVLGLNDALVELTAMLSGITFAIHDSRTVIVTAFITGVAAAFSMAGSEYLSSKADGETKNARVSAIITGLAYMFTVVILLLPYMLFSNLYIALLFTIINAILIIFLFNFYISVAKDLNFKKRFGEMLTISLGVSFLSFLIGLLINKVF
ncbi:VIT1/CCC1 transporter family protein [Clostridium akagii]|uniref:VIT1/CCC1 transporter family protein n=1 Tax=Clostridium akagii TaxID=91623 RepID=UPI00047E9FE5|nr:VIT1/CCC1 transporter family protein [Clostridium akagii]